MTTGLVNTLGPTECRCALCRRWLGYTARDAGTREDYCPECIGDLMTGRLSSFGPKITRGMVDILVVRSRVPLGTGRPDITPIPLPRKA